MRDDFTAVNSFVFSILGVFHDIQDSVPRKVIGAADGFLASLIDCNHDMV